MKTLNVLSFALAYKAALRGYTSAVVERNWNGIGRLTLVVGADIPGATSIAEDDVLFFDHELGKCFLVESISEELSDGAKTLTVTAPALESLLSDYVTLPPAGSAYDVQTGTREQVVREWVDNNAVNPADPTRQQYPIVMGAYRGLGATVTDQTRYANLADEVTRILAPEDLGWRLRLDLGAGSFVFEVTDGVDRTVDAPITRRVALDRDDNGASLGEGTLDNTHVDGSSLELELDTTWTRWAGLTWGDL